MVCGESLALGWLALACLDRVDKHDRALATSMDDGAGRPEED
jgi:hypothetical protein